MNRFYRNYYNQQINNYIVDYGGLPFVTNISELTLKNQNFRTALWTGNHLQLTVMNIPTGESIGLEIHPNVDQFIKIEQGIGLLKMGDNQTFFDLQKQVNNNNVIIIPAGKWHDLINIGKENLKLYSIYAPPQHKKGTIHKTKEEADND